MAEHVAVNPAGSASPDAGGEEVESEQGAGAGEGGASIANAADPDAALEAEETEPGPKKKKLKLGDREVEFDEDVADLIAERDSVYQKRKEHTRAANERFQQAAEVFKRIEGIKPEALDALRSGDPWKIAQALGQDPDSLVTEYAKRKIAEADMSPEQRAFEQQRQQLETRAKQIQEQEQKFAQENHTREVQKVQADFAKNLPIVLEKHGLPDDEYTAGEIGRTIAQLVRQQGRAPTPEDYDEAAAVQSERLTEQLTRFLDRMSRTPGALKKQFPEIAKRLREEDVASITAPRAVRPGKPLNAPPPAPSRPKTYAEEEREFRNRQYESLGRASGALPNR